MEAVRFPLDVRGNDSDVLSGYIPISFVVWNMFYFFHMGFSSSQLTFHHFSEGRKTTNQQSIMILLVKS